MDQVEQRRNARVFVERWQAAEGNEDRESRSFWIELAQEVLGLSNPTHVLDFERRVRNRRIDVFFEDKGILVEQKSRGTDLDHIRHTSKYGDETPYDQARWYYDKLPRSLKPKWIITSNFDVFRIYDMDEEVPEEAYVEFGLEELPEKLHYLSMFTSDKDSRVIVEKELSVKAGAIVAKLYDEFSKQYLHLEEDQCEQRSLNMLIVRLVFLLYAEDAGLLRNKSSFYDYMKKQSVETSRQALIDLFKVLDTPDGSKGTEDKRDPYLPDELKSFPYINGGLFEDEDIIIPQFTQQIRVDLLAEASAGFDWKNISPTIFGAVFESTLNPETRRAGGMHYTSIENIHKVIDPLFLDDLKAELVDIENEKTLRGRDFRLRQFHKKLANIEILDPACGSGNFLTESYLSLRALEDRVLEGLKASKGDSPVLAVADSEDTDILVSVDQLHGIEINDFAVSVAKTALWIAESQAMERTEEILYRRFDFLPLTSIPGIVEGNALRMDWNDVLPAKECSYIIGNPPFIGHNVRNDVQKADMIEVFGKTQTGKSDYVICWFYLAAKYAGNNPIRIALVSTNSICQGESVGIIWKEIIKLGFSIDFAYTTFVWNNEATDQAHVHVVIVGFSKDNRNKRYLFHADGRVVVCDSISPYLVPGENVYVLRRSEPISKIPKIRVGSLPRSSAFTITADEYPTFINDSTVNPSWIKEYIGADEFLNNKERYCLWLRNASEIEVMSSPIVRSRIEKVREDRLASTAATTRRSAATPMLFAVDAQPNTDYLLIPQVSSERRDYIPIGFMSPDVIASNLVFVVPDATLYHFGILTSQFHNAWMRTVCGRMKSDYRYGGDLVYNNYIWPDPAPEQRSKIESLARSILDIRDLYPDKPLSDLYDPDKMPSDLRAAHKALDMAVEEAYGVNFDGDEEKMVAHLFKLYSGALAKD